MDNFILISGCSGGGKSTLLKALKARGHHVVEEPGRRIVEAEQASGGDALPWTDIEAFLHRALDLAVADHRASRHLSGPVFFDRGVMDAAVALRHVTGHPEAETLADDYRYNRAVFLAPPWPDIFTSDEARRHGMDEAVAEYAPPPCPSLIGKNRFLRQLELLIGKIMFVNCCPFRKNVFFNLPKFS